ncbi:MAG: demethoxyubiquinone hydroxylase family protein, partial [Clostridia bacterium]
DIRSANIISLAYATKDGELTAILQYIFQSFIFRDKDPETANTLESIAIAEMMHLKLLGNSLKNLGVTPIYSAQPPFPHNFYSAEYVTYSTTPVKMIMDNIYGEMNAIATYKKMLLLLKNEQVSAIIERIIIDEELHLATLKKLLEQYKLKPTTTTNN